MKRTILYTLLFMFALGNSQELNLPVFTQYLADNDFVISPTYAGIGDNFRIRANGLTQWVGIKNAPDNAALYADFRIAKQSGVGISAYTDKNGNTRQKGIKFSFAHHIILDYKSKQFLSFGLSYNINNFRIDIENFDNGDGTPIVDPSITDDRSTNNNNFDVGFLYRWNRFYFSFNANNFLDKDIDDFIGIEPSNLLNYQIYTGYVFSPKSSKAEFEPSVFYQMFDSDRRSSTDINLKYRRFNKYGDYYWVGGSYRFLNDQFFKPLNIGPMAGVMTNGLYFAYSYQITINDLSGFNTGTHMITIGLDFLQGVSDCPCTQGTSWRKYKNNGVN
ncbi:type IX secretion system membrane protein PorP/SprF [Psychroserpens sp.]|uniref:PorP/SprF family type IX secretion system membrane protein n=1 Tax=Psychroserpens sp. TaxID=2020870 RepID=UPI001B25EE59|nr:type IX secretion system membrane protein PorP/SprF [Psychroserpens sp.]MBO6606390.1 type IX secretion system membrane protein PorP/SprF [Psychroserpens sp.]MBO6632173.1 type IX secretion system membrane protein PorP/SprF [Psychroserpens sp.]MBO6653094.1 type IX secretion system membrane protein PorP/SprF [Psychroserpens sp.]MBO6680878.1 type IX secretion system membrane protein PorP/SprF [Psychroserpens sp.]MBO6750164.1 type IX secretion system membrane protein PorP/SprF [Psychroserpens sp